MPAEENPPFPPNAGFSTGSGPEPELGDILDLPALQAMVDQFHALTGFGMSILDLRGNVLLSAGGREICTKFHRAHPESRKHCEESEKVLCSGVPPGTFKRYRCKNSLWDMATPIVVGERRMGHLFMGHFLLEDEPLDIETFRRQAHRYGFDEEAYLKALDFVPHWSRPKLDQAMAFYVQFAQQIAAQGFRNLQLARALGEQKQIEAALRASESRYRGLIDFAVDGILLGTHEGLVTDANECMCAMAGRTRDELIGLHVRHLLAPESVEATPLRFDLLQKGQIVVRERRIVRPDGSEILVEMHSKMMADGTYQSIFHDITEQLRGAGQLQQAQKMDSIGRLAGGVAHDFNNMLGVILGHTEMAMERVQPDHPVREDLFEIQKAAERSSALTRQLLAFARRQTVTPKVLDLNGTIEGMLKMLRRLIGEDIELDWHPQTDLWPVRMDPSQIDQILANLCVNARDAISGVGRISIGTQNTVFRPANNSTLPGSPPGDYVRIDFLDTGCGMTPEILEHIFEPFFSTKNKGLGSGLGLATVYGVVKQNNGFIQVHSQPTRGTTFQIFLPRHRGTLEAQAPSRVSSPSAGGRESILLVEDEPAILKITGQLIEGLGYTVRKANSPAEAIRLATEHGHEIDLRLTDVVMPEMNGRDLAQKILKIQPRIKCLFMSGYTADVIARNGVLDQGMHFIEKPFTKQILAAQIRKALDSDPAPTPRNEDDPSNPPHPSGVNW